MACAPSEDSAQPGHLPIQISLRCPHEESLRPQLPTDRAAKTLGSDWTDAQANLGLRWAHMSLCWFCHVAAHFVFYLNDFQIYVYSEKSFTMDRT